MDFLIFSHYFSYVLDIQKAIFMASAWITPSLKKLHFGARGGIGIIKLEAIMGWAKSHLSLGGGKTKYDIVVITYHGEEHWSFLVLKTSHTFHFDSKIEIHDYLVCDIFNRRIRGALLLLWGVHPSDPPINELVQCWMSPSWHRLGIGSVDMLFHITFAYTWLTWHVWKIKRLKNPRLLFRTNVVIVIHSKHNN